MQQIIEKWLTGMSCNRALTFMLQLGSTGAPFPTMMVSDALDPKEASSDSKPIYATDHDMVVIRRFYTA